MGSRTSDFRPAGQAVPGKPPRGSGPDCPSGDPPSLGSGLSNRRLEPPSAGGTDPPGYHSQRGRGLRTAAWEDRP